MRKVNNIVIHCTATPKNTTVKSIQSYWKNNLGWKSPGYHRIIADDGTIHVMADFNEITNGVANHNSDSIHFSYIGGVDKNNKPVDNRSAAQKEAILSLIDEAKNIYPEAKVLGHRDFSGVAKACPCFDAITEYSKKEYIVIAGDSLSKIAAAHKTTVVTIKSKNNLVSDLIKIGQKLSLLFLVFMLLSCGTRNTKKTKYEESIKKELALKTEENHSSDKQTETEKQTDTKKEVSADVKQLEEDLAPIDPTKPIVKTETKDGNKTITTWENANVNNKTKTDNYKSTEEINTKEKSTEQEKTAGSSSTKLNEKEDEKKSEFNKEIERTSGFPWWTLWFLLIIPIYIGYQKVKKI